jgi:hypothetical protein
LRHGLLCRAKRLMLLPPSAKQEADPGSSIRKTVGKSAG